jgi:ubiquinone/menaquinone biosynthesis C-methylase UbiE
VDVSPSTLGFDAVVCQFGVMFFPDKPRAFVEACGVLKPNGRFVFNVWDRIQENERHPGQVALISTQINLIPAERAQLDDAPPVAMGALGS